MIYNYMWGKYLCLVGILFNLVDYVTTFIGVMLLGLIEYNPIVNWTLKLGGLGLLTVIKLGLVTLIFMMFYNVLNKKFHKLSDGVADNYLSYKISLENKKIAFNKKCAYIIIIMINAVLITVVVNNIRVLFRVLI